MHLTAGKILMSSSVMDDDHFKDSVLLISGHNKNGITGFVINKRAERPLNALQEFSNSPAFPLYDGGPVDTEHLFFIHRRADLIASSSPIMDDLFIGGDFDRAVQLINKGMITEADIKIFIGYCGWDDGELEAEIEEGSWVLTDRHYDDVFNGKFYF